MEKSDSYWKYSDMYLSNVYQDYNKPAAELAIRVEEIMWGCNIKEREREREREREIAKAYWPVLP